MPFKFALGKARRYNVSSRNAYVVCVNMLDNALIECTLTADGTGHDCLQNIAQRMHLSEIYYFGLQFVNKKLQFRWLDMDRPIKKQLDKHAHSPLLYFRVMFYVADAQTIRDDITRYQYYLQLKLNVIDGKLPCTQKQAVLLGAYSLQAEFGNYDQNKHSAETLQEYMLLPRNMCTEDRTLARLTQEMLELHRNLRGVSQDIAELQYIIESQQLEGYGLDYFPAKDTSGQEILLGASFIGIFVKYLNGEPVNYFKWSDINNLTSSKRNFNIETSLSEKTVHFQMDDPDMVKYVFKMCSLQHKFYHTRQHTVVMPKQSPSASIEEDRNANTLGSIGPVPDIQQSVYEAEKQQQGHHIEEQQPQQQIQTEQPEFTSVEINTTVPPEENHYVNTQVLLEQEQYVNQTQQEEVYIQEQPPNPYIEQQQQQLPQQQQFVTRLPSYRPAPDYETIMRQRMDYMAVQQQQERTLQLPNLGRAQVYGHPELLAYSQPEMSHLSNMVVPHVVPNGRAHNVYHPENGVTVDRTHSLIIQSTYSTPELYKISSAAVQQPQRHPVSPMSYQMPPPYPRSSNSYPDLPSAQPYTQQYNSPDLVTRKNLNNAGLVMQSQLDQSMENLTMDNIQHQQQQQAFTPQKLPPAYPETQPQYENTAEVQYCTEVPQVPPMQHMTQEEQEVFITDPPNPSVPSQFIVHPMVPNHSTPYQQYSENPYENLPPPPTYMHPEVPQHPPMDPNYQEREPHADDIIDGRMEDVKDEQEDEDVIQCIDTSELSIDSHHTSDSVISKPDEELTPTKDNTSSILSTGNFESPQSQRSSPPPSQIHITPSRYSPTFDDSPISPPAEFKATPPHMTQPQSTSSSDIKPSPLKMAAINGLSISRGSVLEISADETRAPKDDRRKSLETKLDEGQVFAEFELIAKKRAKCICTVGEKDENLKRNRFKDILPYDDTRVILTQSKKNPSGYINASHVKMKIKKNDVRYISAQGPLEHTVGEFWQMAWEQNVQVIAMLTGLEEAGKQKCHRYWPEKRGPKLKMKFGEFEVYTKVCQNSGSYITSTLNVTHVKSKRQRQIWHLQYTGWPDHGCPDDTMGFQWFLEEIESVRRQAEMELGPDVPGPPTLVHCSAGVGRSGVLILTHIMRICFDLNKDVEVGTVLEKLRTQRMHMVQTVTQYTFVYNCLVDYLKSARLI